MQLESLFKHYRLTVTQFSYVNCASKRLINDVWDYTILKIKTKNKTEGRNKKLNL